MGRPADKMENIIDNLRKIQRNLKVAKRRASLYSRLVLIQFIGIISYTIWRLI